MRVLVTTTGYPGHLLPLVPFARACARHGHDVCVVGPRSRGAIARQMGLEFCGCADPPEDEVLRVVASAAQLGRGAGHARMMAEGFGRVATRAALTDLLQMVGAWRPDVVVRESQEFAGAVAAERHGVAHARVALGLARTEADTLAFAAAAVDEVRAELRLPADPDAQRLRAAPSLTLVPPDLDDSAPPGSHRFRDGRAARASLPDWWPGNEDPLVYVTFGSVAASVGLFPGLYRTTVDALSDLDARVLVTTGGQADPAELGPLPPNVRAERWVAQEEALAHADAVVCHGGYGTMLGALAHGVPLVVMTLFGGDQRRNGRRIAEIGAGIALDEDGRMMFEPPGAEVIAAVPGAVRRVLDDPHFNRAARRVAESVASLPPVDAAVDVLRDASRHRVVPGS
jgi:UDP:flavonoid glycosyltransferase YjiC (YdhE family)